MMSASDHVVPAHAPFQVPFPCKPTLLDTICEGLGISREECNRKIADAKWRRDRFIEEMKVDGWQARFDAAAVQGASEAAAEGAARDFREVLGSGLSALADFKVEQMLGFIKEKRLAELARSHDASLHGGRLVLGPTGIGKSVAGACLALRRCESYWTTGRRQAASRSVRWVRAIDLPNARLGHSLGKGEAPLVVEAIEADFLIVDDVGWESKRAGADDVVSELFARRYDAGRQSYVTSGLTHEQFRERYSDAIVRRIVESGGKHGKVINLWGTGPNVVKP